MAAAMPPPPVVASTPSRASPRPFSLSLSFSLDHRHHGEEERELQLQRKMQDNEWEKEQQARSRHRREDEERERDLQRSLRRRRRNLASEKIQLIQGEDVKVLRAMAALQTAGEGGSCDGLPASPLSAPPAFGGSAVPLGAVGRDEWGVGGAALPVGAPAAPWAAACADPVLQLWGPFAGHNAADLSPGEAMSRGDLIEGLKGKILEVVEDFGGAAPSNRGPPNCRRRREP